MYQLTSQGILLTPSLLVKEDAVNLAITVTKSNSDLHINVLQSTDHGKYLIATIYRGEIL